MTDRERLVEVLAKVLQDRGWLDRGDSEDAAPEVADALLASDALAGMLAEARAEALREAADALNTTDHATETALQGVDHAIWFLRDRAEGSA